MMPRATPVSDKEVDRALARLPGFRRAGAWLRCCWRFADFAAAVRFTVAVAEVAEELDHHPEWTVRYREVAFAATTHDAGCLTSRDLELAARVSALAIAAGGEPRPDPDGEG